MLKSRGIEGGCLPFFLRRDSDGFTWWVDQYMGEGYTNKCANVMYKLWNWGYERCIRGDWEYVELADRIAMDVIKNPGRIGYWLLRKGHF